MPRAMPTWLRVFFALNVIQDLGLAIGLILPERIPFPLMVTPLNARFIGALYLASAVGMILSATVRARVDARIFVVGFGVVSILVLGVTLLYWSEFTARRVPILWLLTYTVDPIVTVVCAVAWRLWRPAEPGWHRLTILFLAQFVGFTLLGLFLLVVPGLAVASWPWTITPLLAQVYGCFFITFAVGALLAAWEARPTAILPIVASSLGLAIFVIVGSLLHLPRFIPGLPTWLWFGGFGVTAVAFAVALIVVLTRASTTSTASAPRGGAFRPSPGS